MTNTKIDPYTYIFAIPGGLTRQENKAYIAYYRKLAKKMGHAPIAIRKNLGDMLSFIEFDFAQPVLEKFRQAIQQAQAA